MRLTTLGRLELRDGDQLLLARRRKELALLAALAERAPMAAPREELWRLLWDGRDETRGRHSLRQALSDLRRCLGNGIEFVGDSVRLADGVLATDSAEFFAACAEERWDDAIALWGGQYLADADGIGGEAFLQWLQSARDRLRDQLSLVCQLRCREAEEAGRWSAAVSNAEWWARNADGDPHARSRLIATLRHLGRRAEAERLLDGDRPATTLREPDFVGRERAFDVLAGAWNAARAGERAVAVVSGGPGSGRSRMLREFARLVGEKWPRASVRRATDTPLPAARMLILADVAAAPESADAVADLLAAPAAGTLLLIAATPGWEEAPALGAAIRRLPATAHVRLEPFSAAETKQVVRSMAPLPERLLDSLARRLHADTEGHPGQLVRAMHLLVAEGLLGFDPARGWATAAGVGVAPLALDDPLERARRRIDRMQAEPRRAVDAAAVLGDVATRALLAQVAGLETEVLDAALAEAVSRRLLRETADGRYEFFSSSVRDAAYALIPEPRLRAMHRAAARAFRRAARSDARLRPEFQRHRAQAALGFARPWPLRLAAALGFPIGR